MDKIEMLLSAGEESMSLHDDDCLSIITGDIWFWVGIDVELKYIKSTNGVGGDASEIDVIKLDITSIDDESENTVELDEDQAKKLKYNIEQYILDNEWRRYV